MYMLVLNSVVHTPSLPPFPTLVLLQTAHAGERGLMNVGEGQPQRHAWKSTHRIPTQIDGNFPYTMEVNGISLEVRKLFQLGISGQTSR